MLRVFAPLLATLSIAAPDFGGSAFSCPAASAGSHLEAVSSDAVLGDGLMIDQAQARNAKAGRKSDRLPSSLPIFMIREFRADLNAWLRSPV